MADTAEQSISNSIEKLDVLTEWLIAWMDENHVTKSVAYKLRFAMEEIATNAVYYGFPTGTSGTVKARITADTVSSKYSLEIFDDGEPFNPLVESPVADTESEIEDRDIGGLGVFLVKNLSEDCHYQRVDGWNHLTICIVE